MAQTKKKFLEGESLTLKFIYYHRSGNKTIFAKVYVNLVLSVNEKFVVSRSMVKISAAFKGPFTKGCYLIQIVEPVIGRVYVT